MTAYPSTPRATAHLQDGLLWYTFPALDAFGGRLAHGFSTRLGGVSQGCYASLNLGIGRGDEPARVAENYRRFGAAAGFDPRRTVFSWQTHHTLLREATAADAGKGLLIARDYQGIDGLYTREPGLALITHFADCVPLFFYAPDKNIAAASHAGWRGTAAGIAAATVRRLSELGCDAKQLVAVIGPSAGPERYEVDEDCAAHFAAFRDEQGGMARAIPERPGKYLLDLWRANRCSMLEAGMAAENISVAGLCTITYSDIFYSHRIMGNARGSLAGFIALV